MIDHAQGDVLPSLQLGTVVSGLVPHELVEITRVSQFGARVLVEGVGLDTRQVVRRPLTAEEAEALVRIRGRTPPFDGDAAAFLLGAEAHRIRIAHQFDPLFAVNSSIVDPLPHQVEAVYRYLLPLPRIRFLLADDTGAGKTIMTGLLIKELLFRGAIQKILIITPGGLTKQWAEEELEAKFGLHTRLVNRATFEAEPGQFSRYREGLFVTSIDFLARNEGCLNAAVETQWDLIAVDEAHKLSAYEYGSKLDESKRYRAVRALAPQTDHLLFLTATPHRGRRDTFRRLLLLLDEDLFQKDEHVTDRIREQSRLYEEPDEAFDSEASIAKARSRFFLRRLKEEMVDWEGRPLFKPRHTKTVGYDLTPEEKQLYDQVTAYVRTQRREAIAKRNRNVELTLMVMQRRLASSLYAITRTLEKRMHALKDILAILNDPSMTESARQRILKAPADPEAPSDIEEYESLDEDQRDRIDERIFRQVLTDDPAKVEAEFQEVERLFRYADSLRHHNEAKFGELLQVLDSSDIIRAEAEKLLIFTEHRDTLDSLARRLQEKGYTIETIHGQMDVDARREAQRRFKTKAKIMVATDAAGEGINLQFCRYMINWDIPWNPNRLEQRMGRIHRYGQTDDVWVYNLVAQNTREGAVIQRVLAKMDVMREQMGSDRVYDVIDDWLEDVPLAKLLEQAIDMEDERAATLKTDEALDTATRDKAEKLIAIQKKTSLASRLDLQSARELRDLSDERRLQPMFVQRFFERVWVAAGGTLRLDEHYPVWHVGRTPTSLRDLSTELRKPVPETYDAPFVFDKQLMSVASKTRVPEHTRLIGPGYPLFDVLIEWAVRNAREAFARGATLADPSATVRTPVWLIRSTVQDARKKWPDGQGNALAHEKLSLVVGEDGGLRETSPAYLLNCIPPEGAQDAPLDEALGIEKIQAWAYEEIVVPQLEGVRRERCAECEVRREYLTTAFADLILELQGRLNELQQAQLFGEGNAEEISKLERRIHELKQRKTDRLAELELMLKLSVELPDILAQAVVVPISEPADETRRRGFPMRRDDEVEAIAMGMAMSFEKVRGWAPEDVSRDGEHYDIRSQGPDGEKRFIEVKGRAASGPIVLTGPEVDKLRQLGSRAWLYIVTFCKSDQPRLRMIQDPLSALSPEMLYRQVQFVVSEKDWEKQGEEAASPPWSHCQ